MNAGSKDGLAGRKNNNVSGARVVIIGFNSASHEMFGWGTNHSNRISGGRDKLHDLTRNHVRNLRGALVHGLGCGDCPDVQSHFLCLDLGLLFFRRNRRRLRHGQSEHR